MLERLFTQCMLHPGDVEPAHPGFEVIGTFNPGVTTVPDGRGGERSVLLVRVVEQPIERRSGFEPSPRFDFEHGEPVIDWLDAGNLIHDDPRVYRLRSTGLERLRFFSYLKVLTSPDGMSLDTTVGLNLMPANEYEEYGIEDPRITRIGETYYITYVAVSRHGVATALMSTTDFMHFTRHGIIFCPENKDVLLLPERVGGRYVALHRPVTSIRFRSPEMWIARSDDLLHWGGHEKLLGVEATFEQSRIGGGTPPIRTEGGWFTLYHGSTRRPDDPGPGIYTAGALMLDLNEPQRIIAQSPEAVMTPEQDFEVEGFVREVVFPTAVIERGERLYVYYGAADECTAVAGFDRRAMLDTLEPINTAS